MKMKEVGLTILGVLSLFWPWMTVQPFVDDDYDAELEANTHLAKKSKTEIDKLRKEYVSVMQERLQTFRRGVWGSFFFLLTAVIVAMLVAAFLWNPSSITKILVAGASLFVPAWRATCHVVRRPYCP